MIDLSGMIEPCPCCREIRAALSRLTYLASLHPEDNSLPRLVGLTDEHGWIDLEKVDARCPRCGRRGEVLTSQGEELREFLRRMESLDVPQQ